MIHHSIVLFTMLGLLACGQQKSSKTAPAKAVEEERILGEEDDADDLDKGGTDSSDAKPGKTPKDGDKGEAPENLDLSKIEELVYKYKDGDTFKEIAVTFEGIGCSVTTEAGVQNLSLLECAAVKGALVRLDEIPYEPDAKCDAAVDQLLVKAGGLEQAFSTKDTSGIAGCDIPALPADAATLFNSLLKALPN